MLKDESAVLEFKGKDIFNKEFMVKMVYLFINPGDVVLKTAAETLQIKLRIEDFFNPNHAIRNVLAEYPEVDLIISKEKIIEEYYDIKDPFVNSYILFANDWNNELKVPLSSEDTLFLQENNLLLTKTI